MKTTDYKKKTIAEMFLVHNNGLQLIKMNDLLIAITDTPFSSYLPPAV